MNSLDAKWNMIARILEPEVMDTPEEARDYDAMDHSGVNRLFASDFLASTMITGNVLDVGTGTAQIPIEVCQQDSANRFTITAIDLAEHMLALAIHNVERAGLVSRITVQKADAKGFLFPEKHFAAVISNSIIHHIPEPFHCFSEMHRVCAPGGVLFVRDLLRPQDSSTLTKLVEIYAKDANPHQRAMFGASLHAALTLNEVRALLARLGYPPDTIQQTSDRHWTWSATRHSS